jgi:uncharacterized membrane protein YdbT with pleckstrin-like domain
VSYPEKILADDERVVAHLHPHWITLVPATFWFIVLCAGAGVGIAFLPDKGGGTQQVGLIAILVVGFVLLCWLALAPWIRWRTTHYVLTTHRVLIRRGVLRHLGHDISLQRINDVAFSQSLWDRIVRAGTLTIESAGEHGQESLTDIPRSDEVQQMLNRLIEEDADRRLRAAYGMRGQPPYPGERTRGYPPQYQANQYEPQQYPTQQHPQNYHEPH